MKSRSTSLWPRWIGVTLLAGFLASPAGAQQSATPPNLAGNGPAASSNAGTPATPAAAVSSEDVVLKVGTAKVTRAELEALVSELPAVTTRHGLTAESRRSMGEAYVRLVLLSQQAVNDHLDSSPVLRLRLELQRTKILAQAEYDKMRDEAKVSPEEVGQYYAEHQPEYDTIQVREFLVRKQPASGEDPESVKPEDAKSKAESIRKALAAGTSLEDVAEEFATRGVLLIDPKPRTFRRSEMIPALAKATFDLKDGEVSEPVDTPDAFLVAKVFKHRHLEQKEVTAEIEKKLQQRKLDAALNNMKTKAAIWMNDDYFKSGAAATPAAKPPAAAPTSKP